MGMDSKNILAALKAGTISIEDAASEILKTKKNGASKAPLKISGKSIRGKTVAGAYHKVIIKGPGNIDDLKVVSSPAPQLGHYQVRIAVKAFSLNFADLLCARGLYPSMPPYPFTPGLEVSGIVAGVGDGVKSFGIGDPVVAMAGKPLGGHATQLTCPEEQVFHKPESLSFEDACALPVVAVTMLFAFEKAKVQWGEKILIQTATGGTGLIAVQLAKYYGATIFATAGSDNKLAYLEKLDVPYRINYLKRDFEKEIARLTGGRGVDVVINTLPGDAIQKGLNCLSPEGRYIELAMTGIKSARSVDLSRLNNNQTFYSIDPGRLKRPEIVRSFFSEMIRMANQGILRATICRRFQFNEIKEAYRYLENRQNIGKIVVTVPDELSYEEPQIEESQIHAGPVMKARASEKIASGEEADSGGVEEKCVAIIGMSGRFAGAEDLNRFWDNLKRGKNCIREVPEWRWNTDEPASAGIGKDLESYLKWGGFLEDIDKFDPLFFNISPAEAEYMDPQQRLFLEESWKTLEDAGYAPEAVSGKKCGVFVGVGKGDYLSGRAGSWEKANANRLMGTAPSILAARISYLLDLTGPSIAIDTACSSSLVAIHQACQSIINNECEMALAGGICLLTTSELLIMAGQAGMLSPTGQCHTFDNSADGFVAGEGVGVILLKSLPDAIRDGDSIRAVIRGGGFNQDGRTNGITAPSARSQVRLEKEVYDRCGINPESISYVEAHGTGTKLGDPIEISALTEVFRKYTDKKQYCAIGSVKTNIGHTMSAAGAASVIKVASALSHRKIPPSINFTSENEHINFSESPFFVNTGLKAWKSENGYPLRAAVSSFGFSGTNVHMVMEEYREAGAAQDAGAAIEDEKRPCIFVLSAKNGERLREYAAKMARFPGEWENGDGRAFNLSDIAYTSQIGREAMSERLALSVSSVMELVDKLERFAAGDNSIEGLHRGVAERKSEPLSDSSDSSAAERELGDAIRKWTGEGDGSELMSLWVRGVKVDWNRLYIKITPEPRRVSLPTYPFERERYWMTDDGSLNGGDERIRRQLQLHPLLHENRSDLTEQRFSTTFTGDEFFIRDHVIGGKRVLPGVAYLEMARAAVREAAPITEEDKVTISIRDVVWARAVTVEESPVQVHIGLFPEDDGKIAYEVYSNAVDTQSHKTEAYNIGEGEIETDDTGVSDRGSIHTGDGGGEAETLLHSSGILILNKIDEEASSPDMKLDGKSTLEAVKARCTIHKSHEDLYGNGQNGGAPESFMCIGELFLNEEKKEALALLKLPSHLDDTFGSFDLHPSLLNGAFETAIFGLNPEIMNGETVIGLFEKGEAAVPYSLGEIELFNSLLPKECYAHAVTVGDGDAKIFNITLFDSTGRPLARIHNFTARSMARKSASAPHGVKMEMPTEHHSTEHSSADHNSTDHHSIDHPPTAHPMIDSEISTGREELKFIKRFTGEEFYFTDHVVAGRSVMPGTACIEMAGEALYHAAFLNADFLNTTLLNESGVSDNLKTGVVLEKISNDRKSPLVLKNIVWTSPIISEKEPLDVYIRLSSHNREAGEGGVNRIDYEIFTRQTDDGNGVDAEETLIHSRGNAVFEQMGEPAALDIESIKAGCTKSLIEAEDCYRIFAEAGFSYGPGHRGIERLYPGDGEVLARLFLPSPIFDRDGEFTIHPGLMDSALQSAIGLMISMESGGTCLRVSESFRPSVPFALERMEIYAPSTSTMWAHIRNRGESDKKSIVKKLDIDVCDDSGRICARLLGYSSKEFSEPEARTLLLKPSWREKEVREELEKTEPPDYERHIVMLVDGDIDRDINCDVDCDKEETLSSTLKREIKDLQCINLEPTGESIEERFESCAIQLFNEIKDVIQKKSAEKKLIQLVITGNNESNLYMGLSGLMKSAEMENSTLICQTIELKGGKDSNRCFSDIIARKLEENAGCPEDKVICYQNDRRLVSTFEDTRGGMKNQDEPSEFPSLWKERGVYLITGGAGGLGLIFAREIVSRVKDPVIILTGRSEAGPEQKKTLSELKNDGAAAEYHQADVSKKEDVRRLIEAIRKKHENLNGIIHSAGIIRDNTIMKKMPDEFREVLGPKVAGLVNLDEESSVLPLDFFIMFSSGAGVLGNIGQADYACANAFMDYYAGYRESLVREKRRSGRTLSINWPLWQDGGMRVDKETEKLLKMNAGIAALETTQGIRAFYKTLIPDLPHIFVAHGDIRKMRKRLLSISPAVPEPVSATEPASTSPHMEKRNSGLLEAVKENLKNRVSKMMKIRVEKIDLKEDLGSYGFDSISLTGLTNIINQQYGLELPPTLFFEYPTLDGFAKHLVESRGSLLSAKFSEKSNPDMISTLSQIDDSNSNIPVRKKGRQRFKALSSTGNSVTRKKEKFSVSSLSPVAIVGISGKFPMAENVEEFWKNLEAGRNCISEIPVDRWDWRQYLKDGQKEDSTGARWGGFIDGVRDFDPMFFNISPREAELMDPQQRLMMIYVWRAMEDAGISPERLSQKSTGVFISPGINEYMQLPSFPQDDPYAPMGIAISAIPNRISYMFNLHGPSEYCETACSSALVALHRAIVSMALGECEQAVIGAINLLLSPDGFSAVDAFGHLSPNGRAKSFQADADGYVRSEGVGAMIIKPLESAIRDNDRIYAVIRGTGIAHGGKGISLTAPTGSGMKAAMEQAFRNSGVSPETISYLEAHGTATPMGDAIELNTLRSGYDEISEKRSADQLQIQRGEKKSPVYISSLKPCIGHGEIVSGMAALIKVVMALKHKTIPGLAGFSRLNGNISLNGSRFEVSAKNHPWESLIDENGKKLPRRASINSYGFGGVNAHAVIEEYLKENGSEEARSENWAGNEPVIFILSARNPERLKIHAEEMAEFLENNYADLSDIAYTLQTGREAMEYRLAMVATGRDEIVKGLKSFVNAAGEKGDASELPIRVFTGNREINSESTPETREPIDTVAIGPVSTDHVLTDHVSTGPFSTNQISIDSVLSEIEDEAGLKELLNEKNPEKLAAYWVNGNDIPWDELYQGELYRRALPSKLSLPGYPFERRCCWIDAQNIKSCGSLSGKKRQTGEKSLSGEKRPRREDKSDRSIIPGDDVRRWLTETLCAMLGLSESEIRPDKELGQLGFDSYIGVKLINRIEDVCNIKVPPESLIEYNTVERLSSYLSREMNRVNQEEKKIDSSSCTDQEKDQEKELVDNDDVLVDDDVTDAGRAETINDADDVDMGEDVNLDDLSESELDSLLEQHISDE